MSKTPPVDAEAELLSIIMQRQMNARGSGNPLNIPQALAEANKSSSKVLEAAIKTADNTEFLPVTNGIIACGGHEIDGSRLVSNKPIKKGYPVMIVNPLIRIGTCKLNGVDHPDVLRHAAFLVAFRRASAQWVYNWCDQHKGYVYDADDVVNIEISVLTLCIDWAATLKGVMFTYDDVLRRMHLFHVLMTRTSCCACGVGLLLPARAILCRDDIRPNVYMINGGQTAFGIQQIDAAVCTRHTNPLVFMAQDHIVPTDDHAPILSVARTTDMLYTLEWCNKDSPHDVHPSNTYPITYTTLKPSGEVVEVCAKGHMTDREHHAARSYSAGHELLCAQLLRLGTDSDPDRDPWVAIYMVDKAYKAVLGNKIMTTESWPVCVPPDTMMSFRLLAGWLCEHPEFDFNLPKSHPHSKSTEVALGMLNSFYCKALSSTRWPGLMLQLALDLSATVADDGRFDLLRVESEGFCVRDMGSFPEDIVARVNKYLPAKHHIQYKPLSHFP